jgi:DNA polymerase III gamma/tau subunit
MSFNWEKPGKQVVPKPWEQPMPTQEIVLDEQAIAEMQADEQFDVFEDEEQDSLELMSDVNLRLEQGRLYQMVLQGDIFADTNADPKAIRNVQREIRKFVRERMETMVGIRQEQAIQQPIVSSPFNDMEVTVLKLLASKMSKGATEQTVNTVVQAPVQPKKDGITSISGNLRAETTPSQVQIKQQPKPVQAKPQAKVQPKQQPSTQVKSALKSDETLLTKPIGEMTPQELADYDKKANERNTQQFAKMPNNLIPHPSPQQLEAMYTGMMVNGPSIANPWRSG